MLKEFYKILKTFWNNSNNKKWVCSGGYQQLVNNVFHFEGLSCKGNNLEICSESQNALFCDVPVLEKFRLEEAMFSEKYPKPKWIFYKCGMQYSI